MGAIRKSKKGGTRTTLYLEFFKKELVRVKEEYPNLTHKEAFTKAAGNWKDSPENPKNKKDLSSSSSAAAAKVPAKTTDQQQPIKKPDDQIKPVAAAAALPTVIAPAVSAGSNVSIFSAAANNRAVPRDPNSPVGAVAVSAAARK